MRSSPKQNRIAALTIAVLGAVLLSAWLTSGMWTYIVAGVVGWLVLVVGTPIALSEPAPRHEATGAARDIRL